MPVNTANAAALGTGKVEDEADDEVEDEVAEKAGGAKTETEDDGDGATASEEPRMTGIRVGDKSGGGKCDNDADDDEDEDEDDNAAETGGTETLKRGVCGNGSAPSARPAPATDTGCRRRRTGVAAAFTIPTAASECID